MKKLFLERLLPQYKKHIVVSFVSILLILIIIPVGTYIYFAADLQTKEGIMNRKDSGIVLSDRENEPFFTFYQARYKTFVPLAEVPKYIQQAVIASEDKEFYEHRGFSFRGIIRSVILNLRKSDLAYGGSTITQQLVKNSLLHPTKSFMRKYQEIVLAYEIERRYSKDEILEMYLNSVYFGAGAFGVREAAHIYFGKPARELTLAQSAFLAGLLPAPARFSPFTGDTTLSSIRQQEVLEKMHQQNYITPEEEKKALQQKLIFNENQDTINTIAPHFALMVRQQLIDTYGEEQVIRSGFKVKTTLDRAWQKYAEDAVQRQVEKLAPNNATNGAVVVMDPKTGEVKTLVGSKDWYNNEFGKVNLAATPRQPGSAFKPIVYASAFERGVITPASVLDDIPTSYPLNPGVYAPHNYDGKFRGKVLVRRALANSLNVPSVAVLSKLGIPPAVEMAKRLGVTTLGDSSQYGLSLVLGAGEIPLLEMTGAYEVFANAGFHNKPVFILSIEDKFGNSIYKYAPKPEPVISPEIAFLISSILSDNAARAELFGNTLTISRPAAVKTGTTENYRDAWTIGYTPSLVIGVWVGNNNNKSMDQVAGSLGAAPIWRELMEHYLADTPVEAFVQPSTIIALSVCSHNGFVAKEATSSAISEYFIKGSEPTAICFIAKTPTPSASPTSPLSPTQQPTATATPPTPTEKPKNENRGNGNENKNKDKK